jgi:hypothetical protein
MTGSSQKLRNDARRIGVVLYQQNLQAALLFRGGTRGSSGLGSAHGVSPDRQCNAERRAPAPSRAAARDRPAVHFHQRLADRQAQAQSAELACRVPFGLLEGSEQARQHVRFNPYAAVADLGYEPAVRTAAADTYATAGGREFDGVTQQVPEYLLQTRRVGVNRADAGLAQVHTEFQPPALDFGHAHLHCLADNVTQLHGMAMHFQLATGNARDVQQVID